MSIYFNQQITTFGGGFQPMGMGCGCMPMPAAPCTIFGPSYPVAPMPPVPMAPVPMVPVGCCYPMSDSMAAGYCMGSVMANPYAMQVIGDGLRWGYNNIIKPVWNGVVKPVWNFVNNEILKPVGAGLKWLWDHSLGWVLKKVGGAAAASNAQKKLDEAEAEEEARAEAEAEAADEAEETENSAGESQETSEE